MAHKFLVGFVRIARATLVMDSWLDGWGYNSLDPSWSLTHLAGSVGYYTAEWAGANCVTRARCAVCLIIKVEC